MKIKPPTAPYSKYNKLLEVKVATIAGSSGDMHSIFLKYHGKETFVPYKHDVPDSSNTLELVDDLINIELSCA